jgi:hypothetical protein
MGWAGCRPLSERRMACPGLEIARDEVSSCETVDLVCLWPAPGQKLSTITVGFGQAVNILLFLLDN